VRLVADFWTIEVSFVTESMSDLPIQRPKLAKVPEVNGAKHLICVNLRLRFSFPAIPAFTALPLVDGRDLTPFPARPM
jgi:hypothetical protein